MPHAHQESIDLLILPANVPLVLLIRCAVQLTFHARLVMDMIQVLQHVHNVRLGITRVLSVIRHVQHVQQAVNQVPIKYLVLLVLRALIGLLDQHQILAAVVLLIPRALGHRINVRLALNLQQVAPSVCRDFINQL